MSWPGDRGPSHPWGEAGRGRSGLHRAGWWVTPTRGDPRDSATENRPPPGSASAGPGGKGETVVQETTSVPGDRHGSVNPTRSKIKRVRSAGPARAFEGGPPELAGRSHEAPGDRRPRWMVAQREAARRAWTEPGLQASSSAPGPLTSGHVITGRPRRDRASLAPRRRAHPTQPVGSVGTLPPRAASPAADASRTEPSSRLSLSCRTVPVPPVDGPTVDGRTGVMRTIAWCRPSPAATGPASSTVPQPVMPTP